MKATIEFNLEEDRHAFVKAVHAGEAWSELQVLDQHLRSILKHGHEYKTVEELAEHIRREINPVLALLD